MNFVYIARDKTKRSNAIVSDENKIVPDVRRAQRLNAKRIRLGGKKKNEEK